MRLLERYGLGGRKAGHTLRYRDGLASGPVRRRPALAAVGVGLLALPLLFGGCALFLRQPSVAIVEVSVTSLGLVGATVEVALDVTNPNRSELRARAFRYRLAFEDPSAEGGWRVLSQGEREETLAVPGGQTVRVRLSLPFRYTDLGMAISSLLATGGLEYRLDGDARFSAPLREVRVPFDQRGSLIP